MNPRLAESDGSAAHPDKLRLARSFPTRGILPLRVEYLAERLLLSYKYQFEPAIPSRMPYFTDIPAPYSVRESLAALSVIN